MADPFASAGFAPAPTSPSATNDPFGGAGFVAPSTTSTPEPLAPMMVNEFGPVYNEAAPEGRAAGNETRARQTETAQKLVEGATMGLLPHSNAPPIDPRSAAIAEMAGGMLPGIGLFRAASPAVRAASTAFPRVGGPLANALLGAGFGAANEAGHDIGTGETAPIGHDALRGALLGGALSAAAPMVAGALQAIPNMASGVATGLRNAMTTPGREAVAGQILREAAGPEPLNFARSPIPDLTLTVPQATGSPGLSALQRTLASEPGVQTGDPSNIISNMRTPAQMAAVSRSLVGSDAGIEPSVLANAASARGVAAIQGARKALRAHENGLWTAPALLDAQLNLPAFMSGVNRDVAGMPASFRQAVQNGPLAPYVADLGELPPQATVPDINAVRSRILGHARSAAAAGDNVTAAAARGLADSVLGQTEGALAGAGDPAIAAYRAARDFTRQRAQVLGYPEFNAILRPNPAGNMQANDETTFGRFFDLNRGTDTGLGRLQSVIDLARSNGIPANELESAARDYLGPAALLRSRAGAGLDATGAPVVNPQTLASTANTIAPAVSGTPMTAPIAGDIQAAGNAAELLNRPNTVRGDLNSTTYEKLKSNDLVNAILGQAGSSALGAAAGGYAGYQYGPESVPWYLRVPAGMAAGAMAGDRAGPTIGRAVGHLPLVGGLMSGPSNAIRAQLWEALNNPEVYQQMVSTPLRAGPSLLQEGRTQRAVTPLVRALIQPMTTPSR